VEKLVELKTPFKIPYGKDRAAGFPTEGHTALKCLNSNQLGNSSGINMQIALRTPEQPRILRFAHFR
jgi:hypothetical protein